MQSKLEINKMLAKELKMARVYKELTQEQLAKKLRKHVSFVQKYESCERRIDFGEFINLCKTLDIDPHEIIDKVKK